MPPVVVVVIGRMVEVVVPPAGEAVVGGVDETSFEGVTEMSWKMPSTAWNTTTIAGALWKPWLTVPVPWPPVSVAHAFHLMPVTVTIRVAHPTVSTVGRTCGVGAGPQDSTAGSEDTDVVLVWDEGVVDDTGPLVVEVPVAVDFEGGEDLEPTASPMAVPTPRAATTSAATPRRTTVLRRTVMTRESFRATNSYGTSQRSQIGE